MSTRSQCHRLTFVWGHSNFCFSHVLSHPSKSAWRIEIKGRVTLWPILCSLLIWMKWMCKAPRYTPDYITPFWINDDMYRHVASDKCEFGVKWGMLIFCFNSIVYINQINDTNISRMVKYMSRDMTKPTKWVCAQRRLRSAWASARLIRVFAMRSVSS